VIIEQLDIEDDEALAGWFEVLDESSRHEWPDEPAPVFHHLVLRVRDRLVAQSVVAVARDDEGRPVGSLWVRMPLRQNTHVAELSLAVRPDARGAGVGQALLRHAGDVAGRHRRTRMIADTDDPVGSDGDSRNVRFARQAGFEPGLEQHRLELHLPVDEVRLDALRAECEAAARGYRVESWHGPCPEQYLEDRVELARIIGRDAPRDGLDMAANEWDGARLRRLERGLEAAGRLSWSSGVLAPDGRLVGFTQVAVAGDDPEVASQFGTVVDGEHRGRRLGLRLKLANIELLTQSSTLTRRVVTRVAASTAPMLSLNEMIGFETIGLYVSWQKLNPGPPPETVEQEAVSVSRPPGRPRRSGRRRGRARRR
jgi:GNAT superfamily N-acetyltransferase